MDNLYRSTEEDGSGGYEAWFRSGTKVVVLQGEAGVTSTPVAVPRSGERMAIAPNLLLFLQTLPSLLR